MLNSRQEHILAAIVQEYVATAQPVASKTLVEKHHFNVSPATIRNDMAVLEELGFLRQPHTSAGRIPTEEGYRYYLDRFVRAQGAPRVQVRLTIKTVSPQPSYKDAVRNIAQTIVKLSGETAFVSAEDGWHYYTGVANLFQKPEFNDVNMMREMSVLIDRFDEIIRKIAPRLNNEVNVWIGGDNPFGTELATVMVRYRTRDAKQGVIGVVGPQRMNYAQNMKLLADAKQVIETRI